MPRMLTSIPVLPVRSIESATQFYRRSLGFRAVVETDGYAVLVSERASVHLRAVDGRATEEGQDNTDAASGKGSNPAGTGMCRILVDDIESMHDSCNDAGILNSESGLFEQPYGLREFSIRDVDGNLITFFQPVRQQ